MRVFNYEVIVIIAGVTVWEPFGTYLHSVVGSQNQCLLLLWETQKMSLGLFQLFYFLEPTIVNFHLLHCQEPQADECDCALFHPQTAEQQLSKAVKSLAEN